MKITLELTKAQARTIKQGLTSALDLSDNYYMFAPGEDLNKGNLFLDTERQRIAYDVIHMIEEKL